MAAQLAEAARETTAKLQALARAAADFEARHPVVLGVAKFQRRVQRELAAASRLAGELRVPSAGHRLQGLKNNLRGLAAELSVAQSAPGVVAINHVFHARAPGSEPGESQQAGARSVEIDVVAQHGSLWIEVKDVEAFGLGSSRWLGRGGQAAAGVQQQALQQLRAATMRHNWRRWRPPSLLYHFPTAVNMSIAFELRAMGVCVTGPGLVIAPGQLPEPPPSPSRTNLDVTTLCALCSEVCYSGAQNPEVAAWASRVTHWQECLEAEKEQPLLPLLRPYVAADRGLFATVAVKDQFELLLQQFGGAREHRRWEELAQRLEVIQPDQLEGSAETEQRLAPLQTVSPAQRAMFAAGEALQAVTLTANSRAVRAAAAAGVFLETHCHRAVWLTGL